MKKWNKNWNKFELQLDNFTPIFIPIFGGQKFSWINIRNWNCLRIFPNLNVPKVGIKIGKCLDYVPKLQNCDPKNIKALWKNSKNPPWWEVRSMAACNLRCHATTVHFLVEIDRESVLPPIFKGLCDVWNTLKSAVFVTDECNTSSLGPPERLRKLVAVQTRGVSWRCIHSHMYPWSCAPSHVSSDMYVKDSVLCRVRQWEPWSTSVK